MVMDWEVYLCLIFVETHAQESSWNEINGKIRKLATGNNLTVCAAWGVWAQVQLANYQSGGGEHEACSVWKLGEFIWAMID